MDTLIPIQKRKLDLMKFGVFPGIVGADSFGYNTKADVLVTQTVDGIDYNKIYREFQETIALQNSERTAIVRFLTFEVNQPTESVGQLSGTRFEKATEFGEPRGARQKPTSWWLGYSFEQFDVAVRYTYQYLANATSQQIEGLHASVLEADNQLMFEEIMRALYTNVNREADINDRPYTVYSLYNGDGTVPPTYKSNVFDGTHSHYMTSGAATIDSTDLDDLMENVTEHGYSHVNGVQLVFAVNSREGKRIRQFRIADGATYDFIPSTSEATPLILDQNQYVAGQRPASSYRGLNVIGSYGQALIIEDDNFPPAYVLLVGTGGPDSLNNPVGLREHSDPAQRGLRLIKGPDQSYPLTDSFYMRAFGTGVRQRGGAAVMQITASATYTPPAQYLY